MSASQCNSRRNHLFKQFMQKYRYVGYAAGAFLLSALPTLAATGGRLVATQTLANMSQEIQGPFAFGVCGVGVVTAVVDLVQHQSLGKIGWAGAGVAGVSGLAMGADSLLRMVPGATGFLA